MMLFVCGSGWAQGDYLKEGHSGFEFGTGYAHQDEGYGYGGYIGVSIKGAVDFGFSYMKMSFDVDETTENIDADALSPSIILHLIKQDKSDLGINFSTAISYERMKYKQTYNDLANASAFSIGFYLFQNNKTSKNLIVQPCVGIIPFASFYETESGVGSHALKIAFSAGVTFFPKISNKVTARVGPAVAVCDGELTYGIDVAIILTGQPDKGSRFSPLEEE